MFKLFKLQRIVPLTMAVILLVSACSFPGRQNESAESTVVEEALQAEDEIAPGETTELDCEIEGYPCSIFEVEDGVLEEAEEIIESSLQSLKEGTSMAELAEELSSQRGIIGVQYDQQALSFRLEGSPPLWIFDPEQFGTRGGGAAATRPRVVLQSDSPDGPVGPQPPNEEPKKQALLLSPYLWEFGADETAFIASQLSEQRNYDCPDCITLRQQAEEPVLTTNFPIASFPGVVEPFLGWEKYELIHVSTHGGQTCPEQVDAGGSVSGSAYQSELELTREGCRTSILTGTPWSQDLLFALSESDVNIYRDQYTGVTVGGRDVVPGVGVVWDIALTSDFFRHQYPGGLDDALVFISACKSIAGTDFANALVGENTTYIGWDNNVVSDAATEISEQFYEFLIREGWDVQKAFEKTVGFGGFSIGLGGAEADLIGTGDPDIYGREVITLLQPIYRQELKEKDAVPTVGGAGDGKNDSLLFMVQVDGIDEDQNPDDYAIHLAVDGQELEGTFRPMEKISENSYWTIEEVPLPFDAADRDVVELEAWIDLPTGGETRHYLEEVELANCGWTGTLSGSRSGSAAGDIVFPSENLTKANADQLARLAEEGYLGAVGSGAGLPTPEELAGVPDSYILGSQEQYPFLVVIPGQSATALFDANLLGIGNQISLTLSEDSSQKKEGKFSASLIELTNQQSYSIQGDLIWHVDSICSMDVILELIENPLPAGLTP